MKANKLDQVKNSLPEEFNGIDFKEEVSSKEKGHYHILELNKVHINHEQRYVLSARVKKYNVNAWMGIKNELQKMGYKDLYILHDPTFVEAAKPKGRPAKNEESK